MGAIQKNMPATAIAQPTILYTKAIQSELLLRGLPWKATVPEVVLLLLSKGVLAREQDVRMCKDRGGKANGRCVINSRRRDEAIAAQAVLHGQIWGKDTSKHSSRAGKLAPRARPPETHSSSPSAKWPRCLPRALRKDCRMTPPPVKLCVECGGVVTVMTGYVNSRSLKTGKLYMNSACKPCHNHRTEVVRRLKKIHPHPGAGTPCQCCGRVSNLFLDHYHATDAFRGFICQLCNSAAGLMGDSQEGGRKLLTYLEGNEAIKER